MSRRPPRQLSLLEPGMRIRSATGRWAVIAPGCNSKLAVTRMGTVYSTSTGYKLKGSRRHKGRPYRSVSYRDERGRPRRVMVHQLVAWTFHGPPPVQGEWDIHHRDSNPRNNRASNLEYIDRRDHGTVTRVANGANPRQMTPEQAEEWLERYGDQGGPGEMGMVAAGWQLTTGWMRD